MKQDAVRLTGEAEAKAQRRVALQLQQATVRFGAIEILKNIDFSLHEREFVCVIGPSGSGKTTLLRVLAGLQRPSEGLVLYRDRPHMQPSPEIAIVFQDYANALLPWRDVAGNVALALEAIGTPKEERRERIADLLETVGLHGHAHHYPSELSGGMQQRLQIARCLAQNPSVLLMDEPFGALDAMTRQRLQDELLRIVSDRGITAFFVTHDLEEAIYLGDRVIALEPRPGRIAEDFPVCLSHPRDQLETRENQAFVTLRRQLFDFVWRYEK
ncbi:ABC transporter [Rhizobium sp. Root149]|jgi:NitT/TauT family transport system ATP-binding protein|uniref:ABC transporter ATP-binding protein n=1 Tax=Rhizobium sp. Root149 TaxID=1736473 RepID=UPI0007133F0D|nr:ABC transporter ATP-binding protein [Rhizobium sp. Root149]KQZ48926.1 ABC transporter [Rhizobium sp. Root149]